MAMLGAVLLVKGPCLLKELLEFVLKVLSGKSMMSGPFCGAVLELLLVDSLRAEVS